MQISASSGNNINGTIILPLYQDTKDTSQLSIGVPQSLKSQIEQVLSSGDFDGKESSTLTLYGSDSGKAMLIGLGKESKANEKTFRDAGATVIAKHSKSLGSNLTATLHGHDESKIVAFAEGMMLRDYRYDHYKKVEEIPPEFNVRLNCDEAITNTINTHLTQLNAIVSGVHLSRDLGNCPPNDMYPMAFADKADTWARDFPNATVEIISFEEAQRKGMGGLVAVGMGSARKPCMVIFTLNGEKKGKHPVLVGKGITFDTGGISLKPGANMDEMKYDMGGSATVFGTMHALASSGYEGKVVGITCMAENMPSSNAQRPGDVIKTLSGKTIEVLNTDAEGRLVLADGLWKAGTDFDAEYIIDFATLTGACVIALGHEATGLWSNNEAFSQRIHQASKDVDELAWPMPLLPAFEKDMTDSKIADTRNLGGTRWGGANTAAAFLKQFVPNQSEDEDAEQITWAHMDIAGTYWGASSNKMVGHGATGVHVRTLFKLITEQ